MHCPVWRSSAVIGLVLAGTLGIVQSSPQQPTVEFRLDTIPVYGTQPGRILGRVLGADPNTTRVAALVFLSGLGWFSKPFCSDTTSALTAAGAFDILLTTGGIDETATRVALLAVPAALVVPCVVAEQGLPAALENAALAKIIVDRPNPKQRKVSFGDWEWLVKSSPEPVGPGPNFFADSVENAFVDDQGRLHLRLTVKNGRWYAAEVYSASTARYGRYTFTLDNTPRLDPCVVFGAFTWADAERPPREIDALEIGKFCRNEMTNSQFVVQPFDLPGHLRRFSLPENVSTTHVMEWHTDRILFQSFAGGEATGTPVQEWTYRGDVPRADSPRTQFRFNLWPAGQPPQDGREAEIIVRSFHYEPEPNGRPAINALVNAAGFGPAMSPCGLFSAFGTGFPLSESFASELPLPYSLGSLNLTINGIGAPLLYSNSNQVNGQIPCQVPLGHGYAMVHSPAGSTDLALVTISETGVGLFRSGPLMCVAQDPNGELVEPQSPIEAGSVAVVYLSGLGPVDHPAPTGEAAPLSPLSRATYPVTATLNGTPATVEFAGLTPGLVGVGQANVGIPAELSAGFYALKITVGSEPPSLSRCVLPVGFGPLEWEPPVILGLNPDFGPASGGTPLTISGRNFRPGITGVFGAPPVAVTYLDSATLRTVSPPGSGTVSVTVANLDGQSGTLLNAFRYEAPPAAPSPEILSADPSSGPPTGGTEVTVVGKDFQNGATVHFGAKKASGVVFVDVKMVRATTPAGTGRVSIRLTNPDQQSDTLEAGFNYLGEPPKIDSISPPEGPPWGGKQVTITGENFLPRPRVRFGGASASGVIFDNDRNLRATMPPGMGIVDVEVTNSDGQSALRPKSFTYKVPEPGLTAKINGCSVKGNTTVDPSKHRIVFYAQTDRFYIQPCDNQKTHSISSDGTWGSIESHAGTIHVLLVRAGYSPSAILDALPAADGVNVVLMVSPDGNIPASCDVSTCPAQ